MPCSSLLYAKPPQGGERLVLPLKALSERFEVSFAKFGIIWVFVGVGQRHEDHPPLEGPERTSVDASETSEEVCAACPGEAPHPVSDASTTTRTRLRRLLASVSSKERVDTDPPTEEET